jgi:hypothetical protein
VGEKKLRRAGEASDSDGTKREQRRPTRQDKENDKNTQESVNNAYMTLLVASSPFFPSLPDLQVTIRIERTGVSASLGLLEEEGELLQ